MFETAGLLAPPLTAPPHPPSSLPPSPAQAGLNTIACLFPRITAVEKED